jgi:hypothetical protein
MEQGFIEVGWEVTGSSDRVLVSWGSLAVGRYGLLSRLGEPTILRLRSAT